MENQNQKYSKDSFSYLNDTIRKKGIPISADLFGMVTTNTDDLNIGQVLENTLPYVDFVAPMVYPSHFPPTWNGLKNPAANPYDVIHYSMGKAVAESKSDGRGSTQAASLASRLQSWRYVHKRHGACIKSRQPTM
jgi:hypothetical protein